MQIPDPRQRLSALIAINGTTAAAVSRIIGRNDAYLHQYLTRGTPKRLDEDDRLKLAMHFGVDERELGAREPWVPVV